MQSKSITVPKGSNDVRFPFDSLVASLDFHFHFMRDALSNENLVVAPVLFAFQHFMTIPTA